MKREHILHSHLHTQFFSLNVVSAAAVFYLFPAVVLVNLYMLGWGVSLIVLDVGCLLGPFVCFSHSQILYIVKYMCLKF